MPTPDLAHTLVSACHKRRKLSARAGLPPVMDFIRRRRLSVFGHIARLTHGTPAHNALHCQVGLASGRSLGRDWRRVVLVILALAGQTNSATTLDLFLPTSGDRQAILRGHGRVTARAGYAMTTTTTGQLLTLKVKSGHLYAACYRKPEQQRFTMGSGILTSISSRQHSAISGHPLPAARQTQLCPRQPFMSEQNNAYICTHFININVYFIIIGYSTDIKKH